MKKKIIIGIVLSAIGAVIFYIAQMFLPSLWVVVVVLISLILLGIKDDLYFIYAIIITVFLQYWFTRTLELFPKPAVWIDEILLITLMLKIIIIKIVQHTKWYRTSLDYSVLFLLIIWLSSWIVNRSPVLNSVLGLRSFAQFILFFYLLVQLNITEQQKRKIFKFVYIFILIQIPICIYQLASWNSKLPYGFDDAAFGLFSFGASNVLGFIFSSAAVFTFGFFQSEYLSISTFILLFTLFCIGIVLTSANFALFLLPLGLGFVLFKKLKTNLNKTLIYTLSLMPLFLIIFLFAFQLSPDVSLIFKFDNRIQDQFSERGTGRFLFSFLTIEKLQNESITPLLGFGPGMYSSTAGLSLGAPKLNEVLGFREKDIGQELDMDATAVLGELGYLGLLSYLLIFISVFIMAFKKIKEPIDKFWKSLALGLFGVTPMIILGGFFYPVWQTPFIAIIFWTIVALLELQVTEKSKISN
ncbi:MAG: hypothetical protein M1480_08335 [Bacteroidetes bacterium]|nr:hypothetical protein [Bacteroidota bacterium]